MPITFAYLIEQKNVSRYGNTISYGYDFEDFAVIFSNNYKNKNKLGYNN